MESLFFVLIPVLAVVYGIVLYNRLVFLRQNRKNAFSDIDVQLKQRYDLVPTLVETVKGYAAHEKSVLEAVTNARAGVAQQDGIEGGRLTAESRLGGALVNLFAVAENYPDLKADTNFQRLMAELSDIENKIAAARRFFNNATSEYNTNVQQFPSSLIANTFGFGTEGFYEDTAVERALLEKTPDIKF